MGKYQWQGRVALITGASSGLGRAIALAFAQRGARVALIARRREALERVAMEAAAFGAEALAVPADVRDASQVEQAIAQVLERWGRLDILVANAGVYVRAPAANLTMPLLEEAMAINYFGAARILLAGLPHLRRQRAGHLVLISSLDALTPLPLDAPYVASKAALAGLGDVLRQELRQEGIAVTVVYPGRIDTPMLKGWAVPRISAKIPPERVAEAVVRAVEKKRGRVILPLAGRLFYGVRLLAPSLADWLAGRLRLAGWPEEAHPEQTSEGGI